MGAAVKELSAIFDRYWNSEVVYAIDLIGEPLGDKEARRRYFDEVIANQGRRRRSTCRPTDVLGYGPLSEDLDQGQIGLQWGPARAFADPPEKLLSATPAVAFETSVTNGVMMQVWQAKSELVITSPYMIPATTA
jgi:putative cardiolipin synthase